MTDEKNIASLIISIIILIVVIILIFIICYYYNTNSTKSIIGNSQNRKNNFSYCGDGHYGSVQCCGKKDGQGCTHNRYTGTCLNGSCNVTGMAHTASQSGGCLQGTYVCEINGKAGECINHVCVQNADEG